MCVTVFRVMSCCGSPATPQCLPAMPSTRSCGIAVYRQTSSSFSHLMVRCLVTPSPPLSISLASTSPAVSRKDPHTSTSNPYRFHSQVRETPQHHEPPLYALTVQMYTIRAAPMISPSYSCIWATRSSVSSTLHHSSHCW